MLNVLPIILHAYSNNSSLSIIKELISVWKAEKYYPILYVTRNYLSNMTLFLYHSHEENIKLLPTFVTYTTKSTMDFENIFVDKFFWLLPEKPKRLLEEFDENDWIIVNLRQTGKYKILNLLCFIWYLPCFSNITDSNNARPCVSKTHNLICYSF